MSFVTSVCLLWHLSCNRVCIKCHAFLISFPFWWGKHADSVATATSNSHTHTHSSHWQTRTNEKPGAGGEISGPNHSTKIGKKQNSKLFINSFVLIRFCELTKAKTMDWNRAPTTLNARNYLFIHKFDFCHFVKITPKVIRRNTHTHTFSFGEWKNQFQRW